MDLDEYFEEGCMLPDMGPVEKREKIMFPGTVKDFLKWLGDTDQRAIETMRFDELEQLPVMEKYHIDSIGASKYLGDLKYWKFRIRRESENLRRGESFDSRAMPNYNDAFLSGLILIWEMITRRRE